MKRVAGHGGGRDGQSMARWGVQQQPGSALHLHPDSCSPQNAELTAAVCACAVSSRAAELVSLQPGQAVQLLCQWSHGLEDSPCCNMTRFC